MKILILITGLGLGGAEKQVTDLADKFISRGHEVVLVALTNVAIVKPQSKKIRVFVLGMSRTPIGFMCGYMRMRQLIRNFAPDVVHSHMVHANLLARLLRLTLVIPRLICTAHSTNEGGRLRMFAYRITDRLADVSTNVSQEAVATFFAQGAVKPGRMIAVSNGVDTERFVVNDLAGDAIRRKMKVAAGVKIILAVGRLTEAKDYPNLLNAYHLLNTWVLKTELWIAGEGELRPELQSLIEKLNLNDRVRFLGVRHDVPDLMAAADVFVLSSAWEGFGLVVAEAMACQRVVVATDCGGVKEVLANAGYLVKPQDAKTLALALQTALQLTGDERVTLGCAARKRVVEHYSLDIAVERWLKIYAGQVSPS